MKNNVKNQKCVVECIYDEECSSVEKCCDNACGRVCTAPDKATGICVISKFVRMIIRKVFCVTLEQENGMNVLLKQFLGN